MLTTELCIDRQAVECGRCVLCGGMANPPEQDRWGAELRDFCAECIEQEFAADALEFWSSVCGPRTARA